MRITLFLLLTLGLLAATAFADPREDAFRLNEEALGLVKAGRYSDAIAKFREARKVLPQDETLRKNLAVAYSEFGSALLKLGKPEEASAQYRFAAATDPGTAVYHARLGIALTKAGRDGEAKSALSKAILVDPGCVPARAFLGQIHYAEGALRSAIKEWELVLKLEPDRTDVVERLAKARREYEAERNHTLEEGVHFVVSWDGEQDRSVGARILRILEDAYDAVGVELGIYPEKRVRVVLYPEEEFRTVTGANDWVGGLFDGRIRLPVKNFFNVERRIKETIYHEYTHVAVHSVTDRCPTWLNEGLAQIFEARDERSAAAMVRAAKERDALLTLPELSGSFAAIADATVARLAYAQSFSLTGFLMREHGPARVGVFLRRLGEGKSPDEAAELSFHRNLAQLYSAWEDGN